MCRGGGGDAPPGCSVLLWHPLLDTEERARLDSYGSSVGQRYRLWECARCTTHSAAYEVVNALQVEVENAGALLLDRGWRPIPFRYERSCDAVEHEVVLCPAPPPPP